MRHPQVLVVENEQIVALDLEVCLKSIGCTVAAFATTGEEAVETACRLKPDVVLMDIRLEGHLDGIQAAESIRKEMNVPLIFLTAAGDNETIGRAVRAEPSSYLIKPFDERELAAALQLALHRRGNQDRTRNGDKQLPESSAGGQGAPPASGMRIGALLLDLAKRRVFLGQTEIALTKKEFDILQCLARRPGMPLSPETILTEVWGPQFGHYTQALRVHVGHLRKKMTPSSGIAIEGVRGVGYRLIENRLH